MKFPLSDELREARSAATEADLAATLVQRADLLVMSLSILAQQVQIAKVDDLEVPGEDLLEEAVEHFPQAEPALVLPAPETPTLQEQIHHRRQQLAAMQQLLQPLGRTQETRRQRLHHLIHEQSDAMSGPEWDGVRAELARHHERRNAAMQDMGPLRTRRRYVEPLRAALDSTLPTLREDLASGRLVHARARLRSLTSTLTGAAVQLGLAVHLPEVPEEPDADALRDAADALSALERAATTEAGRLDDEIERTRTTLDDATSWITDRTG